MATKKKQKKKTGKFCKNSAKIVDKHVIIYWHGTETDIEYIGFKDIMNGIYAKKKTASYFIGMHKTRSYFLELKKIII